jgi:hypothetical protein
MAFKHTRDASAHRAPARRASADPLSPVHEDDPYYLEEQWSEYDAALEHADEEYAR